MYELAFFFDDGRFSLVVCSIACLLCYAMPYCCRAVANDGSHIKTIDVGFYSGAFNSHTNILQTHKKVRTTEEQEQRVYDERRRR